MKAEKHEVKHEVQKIDLHGIDPERMNAALTSYADTLAEIQRKDAASTALVARLSEIDAEISALKVVACEQPNYATLTIEQVEAHSERIQLTQNQIVGLNSLRTEIARQLDDLMKHRGLRDFYDKTSAKRNCYRIVYDGLLSAFDRESLNQLLAAGMACDMTANEVIDDLFATFNALLSSSVCRYERSRFYYHRRKSG